MFTCLLPRSWLNNYRSRRYDNAVCICYAHIASAYVIEFCHFLLLGCKCND